MAIAKAATDYVFTDFLLKKSSENKFKELRLDLALDKIVTYVAVGLPLLFISLAFAQEVSVGVQISCFAPTSFSWRQAAYVDNYCWAAIQRQETGGLPLSLHKFFPYVLLLVAMLVYGPNLFWRFTAVPVLLSDLIFIVEELDRSYNRSINYAKSLQNGSTGEDWRYPLVEQYLKTKRFSHGLLIRYVLCRVLTFVVLLLACVYLGYYIHLSANDEFHCRLRTGLLVNDTSMPAAVQCKLVAVGVFQLLSYINLSVYLLLMPVCIYAMLVPVRSSCDFLKPYEILPMLEEMNFSPRGWNDLAMYLLFLEENLSELQSYKCLKVLEHLKNSGDKQFDKMTILASLKKVKMDELDGRMTSQSTDTSETSNQGGQGNGLEMKEVSPLLTENTAKNRPNENVPRQRVN